MDEFHPAGGSKDTLSNSTGKSWKIFQLYTLWIQVINRNLYSVFNSFQDIKMWRKPAIRITTVLILAQYMFCFTTMISTSDILTPNGGKTHLTLVGNFRGSPIYGNFIQPKFMGPIQFCSNMDEFSRNRPSSCPEIEIRSVSPRKTEISEKFPDEFSRICQ